MLSRLVNRAPAAFPKLALEVAHLERVQEQHPGNFHTLDDHRLDGHGQRTLRQGHVLVDVERVERVGTGQRGFVRRAVGEEPVRRIRRRHRVQAGVGHVGLRGVAAALVENCDVENILAAYVRRDSLGHNRPSRDCSTLL